MTDDAQEEALWLLKASHTKTFTLTGKNKLSFDVCLWVFDPSVKASDGFLIDSK